MNFLKTVSEWPWSGKSSLEGTAICEKLVVIEELETHQNNHLFFAFYSCSSAHLACLHASLYEAYNSILLSKTRRCDVLTRLASSFIRKEQEPHLR